MMMAVAFERHGRLYYLDPGPYTPAIGDKVLVIAGVVGAGKAEAAAAIVGVGEVEANLLPRAGAEL